MYKARRSGITQNLCFIDLVSMLSLIFMSTLVLRVINAKDQMIPIVRKSIADDSLHTAYSGLFTKELNRRLVTDSIIEKKYKKYEKYEKILANVLKKTSHTEIPLNSFQIFGSLDTLMKGKMVVNTLKDSLFYWRDWFLLKYLKATQIAVTPFGEDLIIFPTNYTLPYNVHPTSGKSIQTIIGIICDTVDCYLNKGYNIITVAGHADPRSEAEYNRNLSHKRAMYLGDKIRDHVRSRREPCVVISAGYGEFMPKKQMQSESTDSYFSRCRRVELIFSRERLIPEQQ